MEPRIWILLAFLSALAAGLRIRSQLHSTRLVGRSGTMQVFAAKYDPFTSDPALSAAVKKELESITRLSAVIIKQELSESGIRTASMPDKKDLEYALAVCRVKKDLKLKEDAHRRSKQAMMIANEVEKIKVMTDAEVIDELHQRGIHLGRKSNREILEGKLATARVEGIQYEEQKNNNLREDLEEIGQMIASGATKAASSGVGEKVINFAKARTFTDAELAASDFLNQKQAGGIESSGENQKENSDGRGERQKQASLSEDELSKLEEEMAALENFDEITIWAQDKPRDWLTQLLESRGEHVPQYAPHSAVVRLLADSEMSRRSMGSEDGQEEKKRGSPASMDISSHSNKSTGGRRRRKESNVEWGRGTIDTLDSFSFEKDLFADLSTKAQRSTSRMLDSAMELISGEDSSAAIQSARALGQRVAKSSVSAALADVIRRGADLGIEATSRLGEWAGGGSGSKGMLTPGQTTFLAAFYTILRRRGAATFVGAFAAIRLCRLVVSLEEREREWEESQLGSSSGSGGEKVKGNGDKEEK